MPIVSNVMLFKAVNVKWQLLFSFLQMSFIPMLGGKGEIKLLHFLKGKSQREQPDLTNLLKEEGGTDALLLSIGL